MLRIYVVCISMLSDLGGAERKACYVTLPAICVERVARIFFLMKKLLTEKLSKLA